MDWFIFSSKRLGSLSGLILESKLPVGYSIKKGTKVRQNIRARLHPDEEKKRLGRGLRHQEKVTAEYKPANLLKVERVGRGLTLH